MVYFHLTQYSFTVSTLKYLMHLEFILMQDLNWISYSLLFQMASFYQIIYPLAWVI